MARYPRVILPVCIILALLSTFAAFNLRWELQLNNLLPSTDEVQKSNEIIEKKFGGLGSLTMVITSPDSAKNHQLAHHVYSTLQQDTMIHFIEYETDLDFYKKHQLLYIDEKDLDTVLSRIEKLRIKQTMEENPFYVNILDSAKETSNALDFFKLDDLEKKYFEMLSTTHSNNDGTIRVLDIYPSFTLSNLPACRKLLSTVEKTVGKADGVKIYYTGKVYNVIQTGRHLLPEAKRAGLLTALFILVLLIIHFYRQPQLIFISALPIGVPILCTLGLAYLIYGRINLFTLLLALLLPGQACQIITHILNRYFMERTRKLSPALSIESALLGIGPSTAVSAFLMASLFFIVSFVPLAGLQELGVLGSIGSVLNWVGCTLLTTSLLQLMQKNKPFKVNFVSKRLDYKITLLSYKTNWIILATISVVSLVGLLYGSQLSFLYDFKKTEMQPNNQVADSLIAQTGFHQYDPIIVLLPNAETGEILQEDVKKLKANKTISKIDRIYTLAQFLPQLQKEKVDKIQELKNYINPTFISGLNEQDRTTLSKISNNLDISPIYDEELPDNIRYMFSSNQGENGIFAFIFSKIDPNNGLECRRLVKDLNQINDIRNRSILTYGTTILHAHVLDLVLSNFHFVIVCGAFLVMLFLLLYYNRLSRAVFTLLPSIFAISWLLILMRYLGIEISFYSALAFPILMGASVDGSLQLWASYYEKQEGTALTVLQKKFRTIILSQLTALIGTYGLLISSHPGLRSIGIISLLGLICIMVSQLTIFPLIAGTLDNYRIHQKKKKELKNE